MDGEIRLRVRPPDTFDAFYRAEYRRVVGLAFVLCGSLAAAEDLAQDGFADAYRRWDRISRYDQPGAWVRRAVANRAVSLRRRRSVERMSLARLTHRGQGGCDEHGGPLVPDEDAELWEAVRGLPRRQAQVIALVYLDDLSIGGAAEVLGCGEGTVRTHLQRARHTLNRRLSPPDRQEDSDE